MMDHDLEKALEVLQKGGTILYPTDTIWGIGCDATNSRAVDKIYRIKFRKPQKSLILLASSVEMIERYVNHMPEVALELVNSFKDPLTIIYENARNLPKNLVPDDNTIAIRIPQNDFCKKLVSMFGKPITSTSANISGDPAPLTFSKINPRIKEAVDYICSTNQDIINIPKPSTIIKLSKDGQIQIIRS